MATGSLQLQPGLSDLSSHEGAGGGRAKWAGRARAERFVCSENTQPPSKRALKKKKKKAINYCVLRNTVLHENLSLGHLDFSTQNKLHTNRSSCVPLGSLLSPSGLPTVLREQPDAGQSGAEPAMFS